MKRAEIIKCIQMDDLNRDEQLLYKVIGEEFLKIYLTNFCGSFYISSLTTKQELLRRCMLLDLKSKTGLSVNEWAQELGTSEKTILKIVKSIYVNPSNDENYKLELGR